MNPAANMALLESIAITAAVAIIVGVALYISFAMLRRAALEEQPVHLGAMLAAQGEQVLRRAAAGGGQDFMLAVRRCVHCDAAAECRAWLDLGRRDGYEAFCPNAGYVDRLKGLGGR